MGGEGEKGGEHGGGGVKNKKKGARKGGGGGKKKKKPLPSPFPVVPGGKLTKKRGGETKTEGKRGRGKTRKCSPLPQGNETGGKKKGPKKERGLLTQPFKHAREKKKGKRRLLWEDQGGEGEGGGKGF